MKVTHIKLSFSNAFLVTGHKTILVDTGMPGEETKILRAAAHAGIRPADISLILHTHAHVDHAGSTAALAKTLRIPTTVHRADEEMLRSGKMNPLAPLRLEARLVRPVIEKPFPPSIPSLLVNESFNLDEFGVEGHILPTPGHTAGSISLLLPDGAAIVGDVMMGGYVGGNLFATWPNYHYFADDLAAVQTSIQTLLGSSVEKFYVGHGGPLHRADVQRRFSS